MAAVKKLTITGYKSIRELRDFELRNLNVLIGANGAGKSNFISFFRMLAEIVGKRFQLFVAVQGGPDALLRFSRKTTQAIQAEFYFDKDAYGFTLAPTLDNRLIFSEESTLFGIANGTYIREKSLGTGHAESSLDQASDPSVNGPLAAVKSWRVYHFHDTGETAKMKQMHAPFDTLRLQVDGGNLAAYLGMLREKHPDNYRMILDTLRMVAPFFGDFVVPESDAKSIDLKWTEIGNPDTPFNGHALSDGTLRFICLCTLLLQPWELMPDTILIDEPELGLHPYAINLLATLLKRAAERKQLIVSTQSVELLDCMEPEDIVVVDRKDDASTFHRLDTVMLKNWLEDYSLGELWKQNVLGGRPSR
jgi:predicted ATPase